MAPEVLVPKALKEYHIFLASPGDVNNERRVDSFSAPYADYDKISAALDQWKKVQDFKAGFQERIGEQSDFPPIYYKEFVNTEDFRDVLKEDLELWLNAPERPWIQTAPYWESPSIISTSQPPATFYQTVINDFQWLERPFVSHPAKRDVRALTGYAK